jgi:hypothetical protein
MSVTLYMDVHIPRAVTQALRNRGVDIITAQEDQARRLPDPDLLNRSTSLGRVLVTFDEDFLAQAHERQKQGTSFPGNVFGKPMNLTIGRIIQDLELLAMAAETDDLKDRVEYLPL